MKISRITLLILMLITVVINSCSDDNSPGGSSNNNNNGGGSNSGGCAGGPSTVTDIDGNVYNVVSIGNQCWMKENLKTTRFKNGLTIQTVFNNSQWANASFSACCDYNNNMTYSTVYGKLYNWYAVADSNGLCPTGWRVPDGNDWGVLINYLGGWDSARYSLKEAGLAHWASPNTGANNSSGFTALPGSCRFGNCSFNSGEFFPAEGWIGCWWTKPNINNTICPECEYFYLQFDDVTVTGPGCASKSNGFSVRCIRD